MADDLDPYQMLYCDTPGCRVNTFERGPFGLDRPTAGLCPGCMREGEVLNRG